jgi:hypothetical protein
MLEAAALKELSARRNMALNIFRPLKHQEAAFEQPRPKYMLLGGANRGGKTVTATALTTGIALDERITFLDGSEVDARMPWQKGKLLTIWLICFDQRHIGDVLYPALFKPGLFQVVHDPDTKQLRTYNPDKDAHLKPRPAPEFIPPRFIESISWESQADKIFNRVTVHNPSTGRLLANIHAFTSKGDPPAGRAVDFIFIDEALARTKYVGELQTRLIDRDGQMVWASWASEDSEDLLQYTKMVEDNVALGNGVAKKVSLFMADNTMLGKKAIADFRAGMSEEEWLQRSQGILPSEKIKMYPLFDKKIHSAIVDGEHEDELSRILRVRDGIPPDSWTKTMVLDPGTSHPAVLFCAVPPPELGDFMVPYQEVYPGRADPLQLAELVAKEAVGQKFYKFLIDRRAGRQVTMGHMLDTRVVDAYARAWAHFKLECVVTKGNFIFASDNVGGRQAIVMEWLHPTTGMFPKLRIVTHRCPKLCDQIKNVKKAVVQREANDERKARGEWDLCDALEYFAASSPRHIYVKPSISDGSPAYQRYLKRFGKQTTRPSVTFGAY